MEVVLLIGGLFFLAFGALFLFDEARNRRGAISVPAELAGFSVGQSGASGASFFHAVARYPGLDGQLRYVESSVGSSSPLGSVGDRLTVLVHPADPEKAAIKSSLTYLLGTVLALVGLGCCALFFAIFRVTPFSLAGAAAVVGVSAWKTRGFVHDLFRNSSIASRAWNEYRSSVAGAKTFTDATKGTIRWAQPPALEGAVRTAEKANRLATPVLVLFGAGLLVLGLWLHRNTAAFLERAVPGDGVVVDLVASHSNGGVTWAPVVEFRHEGRAHRFRDSVSSNPASYRRGDGVRILYDPARPDDARIDRGRWNQAIPLSISVCGALLCALGLWRMARRQPQRVLPAMGG